MSGTQRRSASNANDVVRDYWQAEPNGTAPAVAPAAASDRLSWYEAIEERRYQLEPVIHSAAQFTRHHGKQVLEIGVGVGTDHLQWARAGAECHGVDITEAGVSLTAEHLALHGFRSDLRVADAESLPFPNASFDLVYSWGVIHHAARPDRIIDEIHRVLRPGGVFIGMMYGRRSAVALKLWLKYGLLRGKPRRSLADVIASHMESPGTKAYTRREVALLFEDFVDVRISQVATPYDRARLPQRLGAAIPDRLGWFIVIHANRA